MNNAPAEVAIAGLILILAAWALGLAAGARGASAIPPLGLPAAYRLAP